MNLGAASGILAYPYKEQNGRDNFVGSESRWIESRMGIASFSKGMRRISSGHQVRSSPSPMDQHDATLSARESSKPGVLFVFRLTVKESSRSLRVCPTGVVEEVDPYMFSVRERRR